MSWLAKLKRRVDPACRVATSEPYRQLVSFRLIIFVVLMVIGVIISILFPSNPFAFALGTGLVATGVAALITESWKLIEEGQKLQEQAIREFGLIGLFRQRSVRITKEYEDRLPKARTSIDIMGFGMSNLLKEFGVNAFREWAARCEVRILLSDPGIPTEWNSYCGQRDREECKKEGTTAGQVHDFVETTRVLWEDPNCRFELRLAKTLPSVNMFRIDYESFWGPYLIAPEGTPANESAHLPTLLVSAPGYMFDALTQHFQEVWTNNDFSRVPE